MAAELVAGTLAPTTPDYVVSRRSNTDTATSTSSPSSSSSAAAAQAAVTSPQHVDFRVETADAVNVNEKQTKGRFLTAKYPKHQMGLIRRRLLVEDWIDEQLKILFDIVSHCRLCLKHDRAAKGVRRILVMGVNAPLRPEAKKFFFENLNTKWCILKYI